jgi:hypothetical protein
MMALTTEMVKKGSIHHCMSTVILSQAAIPANGNRSSHANHVTFLRIATEAASWNSGSRSPMCLKSGQPLRYQEKGIASMAPIINHTGLLFITPAIEIANEDVIPGQPMSSINSVVSKSNHFYYSKRYASL